MPADIHVEINLVFETADGTRHYMGLFRPNDSSVAQIRSVMPTGATSIIYLAPRSRPTEHNSGRTFNVREDATETLAAVL